MELPTRTKPLLLKLGTNAFSLYGTSLLLKLGTNAFCLYGTSLVED